MTYTVSGSASSHGEALPAQLHVGGAAVVIAVAPLSSWFVFGDTGNITPRSPAWPSVQERSASS